MDRNVIKEHASKDSVEFNHEKEWKLSKTLLKMPDVLIKVADELYLHVLCEYLYEVSILNNHYLFKSYNTWDRFHFSYQFNCLKSI